MLYIRVRVGVHGDIEKWAFDLDFIIWIIGLE